MQEGGDGRYIDIYDKIARETHYVDGFAREGRQLTEISFTARSGDVEWKGQTYRLANAIKYLEDSDEWEEVGRLTFRRKLESEEESEIVATMKGVGILAVIAAAVLFFVDFGGSGEPSGPTDDSSAAWAMCQNFVEDRLRAPSTADYPAGHSQYTSYQSGGRYRVGAYVDAENASGVEVRTHFTCVVETEDGDSWNLVSLEMDA